MDIAWADWAALGLSAGLWAAYGWYADHSKWSDGSMTAAVDTVRHLWMRQMLKRDLRMIDTGILSNLVTGIGFFASTTIIAIGGLIALLGAVEQAVVTVSHLPVLTPVTRDGLTLRIFVLLGLFGYAFFKFAWAFRLSNYCSILVGAAPSPPVADAAAEAISGRIARVHALVGVHFNRGLRAYFYALPVLVWFVHPAAFVAATAVIVHELWRREFRSRALAELRAMASDVAGPVNGKPDGNGDETKAEKS